MTCDYFELGLKSKVKVSVAQASGRRFFRTISKHVCTYASSSRKNNCNVAVVAGPIKILVMTGSTVGFEKPIQHSRSRDILMLWFSKSTR